ncbi:MAG: hypothetical protein ACRYG7_15535 [Janthinobacterium lividum]
MAKTFKNLPRPGDSVPPRPTSERDFFDLSDERAPTKISPEQSEPARNTGNMGNTGNTDNISNTGNTKIAGARPGAGAIAAAEALDPGAAPDGVRQTFVLSRGHLEQLRDYVHARRAQGEYTYSQKQALQEALDLLFAAGSPVAPRPAQTREQEQQRRQRIQRGRQVRSGE